MIPPRALALIAGATAGDWLAGWIEGRTRYHLAGAGRSLIPASSFPARSNRRAASDAAVAYYLALNGD